MGRLWELVEELDASVQSRGVPAITLSGAAAPSTRPPQARLWMLLDRWSDMDEGQWSEDAVDRLHNDIMDVFDICPVDAGAWFREWRAAHPAVKLT